MEHILIYPLKDNEKGQKSIKLSISDALKLCNFKQNGEILFQDSKPILKAIVNNDNVEFITEDTSYNYTKSTVNEIFNKYYYVGQKCKKKC